VKFITFLEYFSQDQSQTNPISVSKYIYILKIVIYVTSIVVIVVYIIYLPRGVQYPIEKYFTIKKSPE